PPTALSLITGSGRVIDRQVLADRELPPTGTSGIPLKAPTDCNVVTRAAHTVPMSLRPWPMKWMGTVLALALVATLAACGGGSGQASRNSPTTTRPSSTTTSLTGAMTTTSTTSSSSVPTSDLPRVIADCTAPPPQTQEL